MTKSELLGKAMTNLTMTTMQVLAALSFATSPVTATQAQARPNQGGAWAHTGTGSPAGGHVQRYAIEGHEIIAPPWSAACMTDHGPSACGERMWFYASSDALARYGNAF
jgi:hypothetical protein